MRKLIGARRLAKRVVADATLALLPPTIARGFANLTVARLRNPRLSRLGANLLDCRLALGIFNFTAPQQMNQVTVSCRMSAFVLEEDCWETRITVDFFMHRLRIRTTQAIFLSVMSTTHALRR